MNKRKIIVYIIVILILAVSVALFCSFFLVKKYAKTETKHFNSTSSGTNNPIKSKLTEEEAKKCLNSFADGSKINNFQNQDCVWNRGDAMNPTIKADAYAIFDKDISSIKRGDIVVFKFPEETNVYSLKRVVGLPNEKISIKNNLVFINDTKLDETQYFGVNADTPGNVEMTLKGDEYYILGDNRKYSYDSRIWGPLKKDKMVGKFIGTVETEKNSSNQNK